MFRQSKVTKILFMSAIIIQANMYECTCMCVKDKVLKLFCYKYKMKNFK